METEMKTKNYIQRKSYLIKNMREFHNYISVT